MRMPTRSRGRCVRPKKKVMSGVSIDQISDMLSTYSKWLFWQYRVFCFFCGNFWWLHWSCSDCHENEPQNVHIKITFTGCFESMSCFTRFISGWKLNMRTHMCTKKKSWLAVSSSARARTHARRTRRVRARQWARSKMQAREISLAHCDNKKMKVEFGACAVMPAE